MNKMKRVLSIILSVMLLVGTLPAGVFAEETSGTQLSENSGAVQESSLEDSSIPEDSEDSETGDSSSEDSDSTTIDSEVVTDSQNENIATASEEEIDAQANENTIIIAGGDFQEAGDHTASSENVKNILAQVSKTYDSVDGFLFIGDYDCETHDDSTQTASGITALMEAVQSVYSNINDDNSVLAQGNHDYMDSRIDATGGHDFDEYSAFVLNEDDYPNYGGTESGVKALATQLETYLTAKIQAAYDKPIFIVSHLPLAFTPRTNVQGDAKYAKYLFDVLNAGGEAGLNIIFLHGHDHAYGYEEYLGGEAIYLPKGDKINIAEVGSQSSYTTETLNFTYMNAGYTGYYNEFGYTTSNAGTNMLTMTTFEITDSSVIVSRYNANGTYNLKTAGELKGNHINNVSVSANTDVYTTTQTIELTTPETPNTVADSNGSGATVTANGITGTTVTSAIKNVDGYSAYVTYSISVNNYTQGDEATVVVPVDTTLFDVNKPVKVLDNGNVIKTTSIVNGTVTFTTNHFSDYDVTQVAETEWVEIGSDETFYTYELDTNGIDTGSSNKYLIVGYESGSSSYDYALTAEGSNTGAISVDISGNTITTSTRNYEWYITTGLVNTNSTNYKYFITQDGSTWLYHTDSSMFIGGTSVGSTKYSRGFWRIETSNQNNGVYTFRDKDNADWYLRYSASGGKFTVSTDTYSVRLYKYSGTTTGEKIYVALNSFNGSVVQNANANASTGATIAIKDSTETVNVRY